MNENDTKRCDICGYPIGDGGRYDQRGPGIKHVCETCYAWADKFTGEQMQAYRFMAYHINALQSQIDSLESWADDMDQEIKSLWHDRGGDG